MIFGIVQAAYVLATGLFILALHWMNDPKTARKGVISGVAGMSLAVIATWAQPGSPSSTEMAKGRFNTTPRAPPSSWANINTTVR